MEPINRAEQLLVAILAAPLHRGQALTLAHGLLVSAWDQLRVAGLVEETSAGFRSTDDAGRWV